MASLLVQFDTSTMLEKTASTLDALVISNGSVISPNGNGDELVVENSSAPAGISILSPNNAIGVLIFGDSDDNDVAWVRYDHANQRMDFRTEATSNRMVIDSSGNVGVNTTSPAEKLDVNGNVIADAYKLQDGGYANRTVWTSAGATKTVSNTTSKTTLMPTGSGSLTIPAALLAAGVTVRIKAGGIVRKDSGTVTFRDSIDGSETARTFNATITSDVVWTFEADLSFSSATAAKYVARLLYMDSVGVVKTNANGATSSTKTITGDLTIDLLAECSAAHADNRVELTTASVELMRA